MLENLFKRVVDLRHGVSDPPTDPTLPPVYTVAPAEVTAGDGDNIYWQGRNCRIVGYDAPESRTKDDVEKRRGLLAKARLQHHIDHAKTIQIKMYGTDRFNRPLIYVLIDGVDVANTAILEGWGVRYEKGKKPRWKDPGMHFSTDGARSAATNAG